MWPTGNRCLWPGRTITNYKFILVKFVVVIDYGELAAFGADGIGADIVWAKIMIKIVPEVLS